MLYIVAGVPRSGKSTVRKKMLLKGVSGIGTDDLIDVFQTANPELGIHFGAGNKSNSPKLWPYILAFGDQFTRNHEDFLIEGDCFDLDLIQGIADRKDITVCFIGCKEIDLQTKLHDIRTHAETGDWTFMHSDEELLGFLKGYIEKSERYEDFCKEHGIRYYDTSNAFEDKVNEIVEDLTKNRK